VEAAAVVEAEEGEGIAVDVAEVEAVVEEVVVAEVVDVVEEEKERRRKRSFVMDQNDVQME
jgi:hypothetical protein